jgi:hypothetical protein
MNNTQSYVSWGAVFAGAALACAFSVVMTQFGSAIGFSVSDMRDATVVLQRWHVFTILFGGLLIQVWASALGGYAAGRLRQPIENASSHESEVRDGAHGVLVWATATLAVFVGGAIAAAFAALAPEAVKPAVLKTPELIANQKTVAIICAFSAAASSLASAVVAWYTATKGGEHRDSGVDLSRYFSFK